MPEVDPQTCFGRQGLVGAQEEVRWLQALLIDAAHQAHHLKHDCTREHQRCGNF